MKTYGQSSKWKQSWRTFPLGMSLWHTGISSDIHTMSLETYMQMYRALHVQRCLRFSHCCTCIFKLICHAHESVYADTFTYEHSCHSPGCDSGWQVLCHFPRVTRGGVTTWQGWGQRDVFHSLSLTNDTTFPVVYSHSRVQQWWCNIWASALCAHVTHTCCFGFVCGCSS